MRQQLLLEADQEYHREFEPFGTVQGDQRHLLALLVVLVLLALEAERLKVVGEARGASVALFESPDGVEEAGEVGEALLRLQRRAGRRAEIVGDAGIGEELLGRGPEAHPGLEE